MASQSESASHTNVGHNVGHESAEHEAIGNMVELQYDNGKKISGKDFSYVTKVHKVTLSFGLVVALAGDFYANWTIKPGDVEQLSDNWDTNPKSSIDLALTISNYLDSDSWGYLKPVLRLMKSQEKDVRDRMAKGQDVAQVYKDIASRYDTDYAIVTKSAYGLISQCNWDHFGQFAIKAYKAVHTAALRQAKVAHDGDQSQADANLKQAYFLEAFAQHYLTDLFSSGHLRAPRRVLHKNYIGEEPNDLHSPDFALYPADRCAQKMHDEDCANGLWVSNKLGDSWAAYGDKQLWSGKCARNFQQAVKAAQTGADEIWTTRQTGVIPSESDFEALNMVPILDNLNTPTNFVPMFRWDSSTPNELSMRVHLDDRSNLDFVSKDLNRMKMSNWNNLLDQISKSEEDKNMYPFTKSFLSQTNIWHLKREGVLNIYGPVDSGAFGSNWSMKSQYVMDDLIWQYDHLQWVSATMLNGRVCSLVGRDRKGDNISDTVHLGLKLSSDGSSVDTVWKDIILNDNSAWTEGDVCYGKFSQDSDDMGMIKYWTNGPQGASKLELWTIDKTLNAAPVKQDLVWNIERPISFMFSYKCSTDNFETFFGCEPDIYDNSAWNCSSWTKGYSNQILNIVRPVQASNTQLAFLPATSGTKNYPYLTVQPYIFGGRIGPVSMAVIRDSQGNVRPGQWNTNYFDLTWDAPLRTDYLIWFLADVNGNSYLDLVTLVTGPNSALTVVVFPGTNSSFEKPVVSKITVDEAQGKLFNAPFMKPVWNSQAQFTYPEKTSGKQAISTSSAGIMMLFDNFGILGSRMIAPVEPTGTYNYEFKGQTPAIAGQLSASLGMTDENWMGRGDRPRGIGFVLQ